MPSSRLDALFGQQRESRMVRRRREHGGHDGLLGADPHQPRLGACAQRQAETVEQDRLAGAGLAGQHGQAGAEIKVEPLDQHHVADRERGEHGGAAGRRIRRSSRTLRPKKPGLLPPLRHRRTLHLPVGDELVIAIHVPFAAGIVMSQHRRRPPRLVRQAEDQIDLRQPVQRLGHVVGGLEIVHHALEAADRGGVQMLLLVPAADVHLLAGQMVAREVDLQPRIAAIGAVGEAVDHLLQRGHRVLRALLVARDVGDLLVIAQRPQVIGIGDVAARRVQLDEAVQRADRRRCISAADTAHSPASSCALVAQVEYG